MIPRSRRRRYRPGDILPLVGSAYGRTPLPPFEWLSLGGLSVTALGREQRYRSGTGKEAGMYISVGAILLIILIVLLIIFVF
jgi:hypothetical protein